MKQRYIDFALLAGIGVLLIAILVLALSAAPMRGSAADDPLSPQPNAEANGPADQGVERSTDQAETQEEAVQEETAQDQPSEEVDDEAEAGVSAVDVTPEEEVNVEETENAQADTEAATSDTDVQTGDAEQNTDQAADQTTDQATEETQTETEQTPPTSNVTLDRVGFAFITAESGACSIPLQPWRQVAVSRDLLAEYGCGTEITVDLADTVDGKDQVTAQIADTMNSSFERTVNIFVGEEEPALEYGVTTGTIEGSAQ